MTEYLYRYDEHVKSSVLFGDMYAYKKPKPESILHGINAYDAFVDVELCEFKVIRHTPKGVFIDYGFKEKFVLNDAIKKFAYSTKRQALANFIRRRKMQVKILRSKLHVAETALSVAKSMEAGNAN
ncbi:MAG: hypothetical protein GY847_29020 [Proteobacteria bacterium]|nr:hypothetical protein [Pseudomonadota bacterium]